MITPAGMECRFYYEDFHRGRATRECRLLKANPESQPWRPRLCASCPVPSILWANACPNMSLTAWVGWRWLFWRQVQVRAYCSFSKQVVTEPHVGCGHCHETRIKEIEEKLGEPKSE